MQERGQVMGAWIWCSRAVRLWEHGSGAVGRLDCSSMRSMWQSLSDCKNMESGA